MLQEEGIQSGYQSGESESKSLSEDILMAEINDDDQCYNDHFPMLLGCCALGLGYSQYGYGPGAVWDRGSK